MLSVEEIINEIKSLSPSDQACEGILNLYYKEKEKNKEAINYMYDLLNTDIINIGTADINNLLSILEE